MTELAIFEKGGLVMYALALMSVYTVTIALLKLYQFWKANILDRSFIDISLRELKSGDAARATRTLQGIRGPIANVMRVGIVCLTERDMPQTSREAEITRVGAADLRALESHLRGLEAAASIAPLMGLLGTVIGMIKSFAKLGQAGTRIDPTMLAGGIWEALLTTAGGLAVAIPALAAYYIFDSIIERARGSMKDVAVRILTMEEEFRRNERMLQVEEQRRRDASTRAREETERLAAYQRGEAMAS